MFAGGWVVDWVFEWRFGCLLGCKVDRVWVD